MTQLSLFEKLHTVKCTAQQLRRRGSLRCEACGRVAVFIYRDVLGSDLIASWELDASWVHAFNERESCYCVCCGTGLRSRQVAAALVAQYGALSGSTVRSLTELCSALAFRSVRIAEINACGQLHQFFTRCSNVVYSEYASTVPGIHNEDLLSLSYPDASFDLCLTSDTLEHVPDVRQALLEIRRVLVPGGRHIFTIPVVWDRLRGRVRAATDEQGRIQHYYPPTYHGCCDNRGDYLAFTEFGCDVVDLTRSVGFRVSLVRDTFNPAVVTFVTVRC